MKILTDEQIIALTPEQIVALTPSQLKSLENSLRRNVIKQGYKLRKTVFKHRIGNEHEYLLLNESGCIEMTGDLFDAIVWAYEN